MQGLNRSLAWFSIGLGVAELLAPRSVGRAIGVGERTTALRLCGVREIASGVGLLSGRSPTAFALSRVAGDIMDLSLLGAALRSPASDPSRIAAAATAVAGVTALDVYASQLDARGALAAAPQTTYAQVSLAINASPERLYAFWRKLENLPRFMRHIESVRSTGEKTSHWAARLRGGPRLEWEAELTQDEPNSLIAWRTTGESEVSHSGSVHFEPAIAGRGTIVRVRMSYGAPGGQLGTAAAKLLGDAPEQLLRADLRRLKQLIETGEVTTTRGQPTGTRSLVGRTLGRMS